MRIRQLSIILLCTTCAVAVALEIRHFFSWKNRTGAVSVVSAEKPSRVISEPVPLRDVSALARDADLIAAGRVDWVVDSGTATRGFGGSVITVHLIQAQLTPTRILKGHEDVRIVPFTFFTSAARSFRDIHASQFGIFFLRREQSGSYVVVSPYYPFAVALPGARAVGTETLDRISNEFAFVLGSAAASQEQRIDAVDGLDTINTPSSTSVLVKTANHAQDSDLRLLAAAALLRRNEVSNLSGASNALLQVPHKMSEAVLWKLVLAVENGVRDPKAIRELSRLLLAQDVRIRRAAASALRHTATSDATAGLVRVLSDSDSRVRYTAVIGLAEITGQYDWGPSIDLFEQEEGRYLAHWKEWGKTQK